MNLNLLLTAILTSFLIPRSYSCIDPPEASKPTAPIWNQQTNKL